MSEKFGKYGLPLEVKFCKKCTMNNQRPSLLLNLNKKREKKRELSLSEKMEFVKLVVMLREKNQSIGKRDTKS